MKYSVIVLLTVLSSVLHAAEKIPLTTFLQDLREQLHSIERQAGAQPAPGLIKNVHVELQLIAEKDQQGNMTYYVLEGLVDKKDAITQRLSFDIELRADAAESRSAKGYRTYSTRQRDYTYGADRYRSAGPYPYHPGHYMPDIYPVIQYNPE